ncbi:GNAT family N-acetyltransferase [Croceitalea sp. MTPC9]|uniref:GNAT family N-acetyltransferase n=1 Tax=unclassified Croceitalea TaxID=2632280 RepID=UPI002B39B21D|nr:GNAT family N-acetyltransferase [Croceitalea sp. MTPC6]GMN15467.1 GNAT family N-acetyltransferase [Croceitalea sp. MTPC9]
MLSLKGNHVYLRALESNDLDFLYELENNPNVWEVSGTLTPYSKGVLKLYLDNAHRDIYEVKQLRLAICNIDDTTIGLLDIFDFDPKNLRAGVGIIILEEKHRKKGVGEEVLEIVSKYLFSTLNLHQLYANILEDNVPSIRLFEKKGFKKSGIKKDWILSDGEFKNEILYQKIKP